MSGFGRTPHPTEGPLLANSRRPSPATGFIPDPATITTTLSLVADSIGLVNFAFGVAIVFGSTPSMGANLAAAEILPKPGTAALLCLGLTGLAIARRRRMSLGC